MTYRTVRIVAELRLRKSTARFARCSAVSHGTKTIRNRFCLFAGYSPLALCARTHNLEGRGAQSRNRNQKKKLRTPERVTWVLMVAEMGFEPHDLRVMSPTSCQTAPLRDIIWCRKPGSNRYEIKSHGILSPGRLPIPPFRHMRPCVPTHCLSIIALEIWNVKSFFEIL